MAASGVSLVPVTVTASVADDSSADRTGAAGATFVTRSDAVAACPASGTTRTAASSFLAVGRSMDVSHTTCCAPDARPESDPATVAGAQSEPSDPWYSRLTVAAPSGFGFTMVNVTGI